MKILKIQNHVGQNADKVWKGMIFSFRPHLGPSQTMFSMDQKTKHAYQKKKRARRKNQRNHTTCPQKTCRLAPKLSELCFCVNNLNEALHQCGWKVAQQLCRNMASSKYGEAAR